LFRSVRVGFGYVWLDLTTFCHLARGSGSIMGPLFKFLLARGSDPYMWSLFSNCTSRVVVVRLWDRSVGGRGSGPGRQDSLGSDSAVSEELAGRF